MVSASCFVKEFILIFFEDTKLVGQKDIRSMFGITAVNGGPSSAINNPPGKKSPTKRPKKPSLAVKSPKKPTSAVDNSPKKPTSAGNHSRKGGGRGNIFGFGGTSFNSPSGGGGLKTAGKTGTHVVNPGWRSKDNSAGAGTVINAAGSSANGPTGSTGGAVLGGGTAPASLSARDMARLKWANANHGNPAPLPKASQRRPADTSKPSSMSPKPAKPSLPSSSSSGQPPPSTKEVAKCPVCGSMVAASAINAHLDQCLNQPQPGKSKASEERGKSSPEPNCNEMFSDSDDELLMKAVEEVEEASLISIDSDEAEDDQPLLAVEDSDDDEPLIKRRLVNDSMDQVVSFVNALFNYKCR